jgi:hypothetical protein
MGEHGIIAISTKLVVGNYPGISSILPFYWSYREPIPALAIIITAKTLHFASSSLAQFGLKNE